MHNPDFESKHRVEMDGHCDNKPSLRTDKMINNQIAHYSSFIIIHFYCIYT